MGLRIMNRLLNNFFLLYIIRFNFIIFYGRKNNLKVIDKILFRAVHKSFPTNLNM
jgi:hypothetical protein